MYEKFNILLKKNGKRPIDVARSTGISTSTLSDWKKGRTTPKTDKIQKIADYFDVPISYFYGEEETHGRYFRVPVLGRVHAGTYHDMYEDIEDYEELNSEQFRDSPKEYFCLKIKGHSMESRICDGDTVVVHRQHDAETGDIVIASVNGNEGACKVLKKLETGGIALVPWNQAYEPSFFSAQEVIETPVSILGVVQELRRKI